MGWGPLYIAGKRSKLTTLSHIHFGVIQRSKGQTALARLAYQRCSRCSDPYGRHADYRGDLEWHKGTAILIPSGGTPEYSDPTEFLLAVIHQESRRDAQEGRTIDFALPRSVPEGLELAIGAWALAPLVKMGMTIEVDAERPFASDGRPHPHIHAYAAQRELTASGFGAKRREWDLLLRKKRGRFIRHMIASRIAAACQLLGLPTHVDPRPKAFWSSEAPEERISHKLWRRHARGVQTWQVEALKTRRASGSEKAMVTAREVDPCCENLIADPADYHVGLRERADRIDAFCAHFGALGFDPGCYVEGGRDIAVVMTFGGQITYDGESLVSHDLVDIGGLAQSIVDFARSQNWSALHVQGDDHISDALAVAGAPHGLVPINRSPSSLALAQNAYPSGAILLDEIKAFDLRGVVAGQIAIRCPEAAEAQVPPAMSDLGAPSDLSFFIEDFPTPDPQPARVFGGAPEPSRRTHETPPPTIAGSDALTDFLAFVESLDDRQEARTPDRDSSANGQTPFEAALIDDFPKPDCGFPISADADGDLSRDDFSRGVGQGGLTPAKPQRPEATHSAPPAPRAIEDSDEPGWT